MTCWELSLEEYCVPRSFELLMLLYSIILGNLEDPKLLVMSIEIMSDINLTCVDS